MEPKYRTLIQAAAIVLVLSVIAIAHQSPHTASADKSMTQVER